MVRGGVKHCRDQLKRSEAHFWSARTWSREFEPSEELSTWELEDIRTSTPATHTELGRAVYI